MKNILAIFGILISIVSCKKDQPEAKVPNQQKEEKLLIEVKKATESILVDGLANESIWNEVNWHPIDQLWVGKEYDSTDFQGRYKMTWTDNSLYVLAEIMDDSIFDQRKDPLKFWWDDDCVEVFVDEDNSGGEHQYNHNAFAYHVALDGNAVDMSTKEEGILFNDHVDSKHTTNGNIMLWELKFNLYNSETFDENKSNTPVKLTADKKIGFAIAYCDNDGSPERENFIGSIPVDGEDKNQGWIDANIFGTLVLKD